jgi:hypothetical protein
VASKNVKVVVVGNPANTNAWVLQQTAVLALSLARSLARTHAHRHACRHAPVHTHARARTRTHAHAHAHATHTHTRIESGKQRGRSREKVGERERDREKLRARRAWGSIQRLQITWTRAKATGLKGGARASSYRVECGGDRGAAGVAMTGGRPGVLTGAGDVERSRCAAAAWERRLA